MELHAPRGLTGDGQGHDLAVVAGRGDQPGGQAAHDQRVVPPERRVRRHVPEEAGAVVPGVLGSAVDGTCALHPPAEHLPERLMPQAHAQQRNAPLQARAGQDQRDAAGVGRAGAGADEDGVGLGGEQVVQRLVLAAHVHPRAQREQVVREVPGERVAVVQQQHPRARMGRGGWRRPGRAGHRGLRRLRGAAWDACQDAQERLRLVHGFLCLAGGVSVDDGPAARADLHHPAVLRAGERGGADQDVHVHQRPADDAQPAGIPAARAGFEVAGDLHHAFLRRARDRPAGEGGGQYVPQRHADPRAGLDLGHEVHHVAVALDEHQVRHGHAPRRGHAAQVMPHEVHEHGVLGDLLRAGAEFRFEGRVLGGRVAAAAGARDGPSAQVVPGPADQPLRAARHHDL